MVSYSLHISHGELALRAIISGLLLGALFIAAPAAADPTLPDDEAQNPAITTQVMPKRCTGGSSIPSRPGACRLTPRRPDRPTVVLWGDSHAWQHIPGLRAKANAHRVNLIAFVMGACPPMVLQKPPHAACVANAEAALARIKTLHRQGEDVRVVLGAHWQFYRGLNVQLSNGWTPTSATEQFLAGQAQLFAKGNARLFRTLGRLRVRTAVIGQVPWVPADRADCEAGNLPYRCDLPRSQAIGGEADVRAWLASRMRLLQRPWSIDVTQRLCDDSVCRAQVGGADVFLDDLHLNPELSRQLRTFYRPVLDFAWS